MGKFRDYWLGPERSTPKTWSTTTRFSVGQDEWFQWRSLVDGYAGQGRVTRAQAMAVPAIKGARDYFAGLGALPLHAYNNRSEQISLSLLDQPDPAFVRSVTMARTIDDLFFESKSLWIVRNRDYAGFPVAIEHIEFDKWTWNADRQIMQIGDEEIKWTDCILFTSPNDPLCTTSAPTVRALLALERSAAMYIDSPEATEYFQPEGDQEPNEEQIRDILDDIAEARRRRTIGWLPGDIRRIETHRMTGQEMQLIEAREFSIAETSRLTGISPNWLALNITTRTYSNAESERRDFVDFAAKPYLIAIEQRLSQADVTPRGNYVRFNLDAFLRATTLERYQAHQIAIAAGLMTPNECRALEDLPPLPGGDTLRVTAVQPALPAGGTNG